MRWTLIYLYGVQGVECSNHSVPTKNPYKIQSLSGDWIFLCLLIFQHALENGFLVANWLPIEIPYTQQLGSDHSHRSLAKMDGAPPLIAGWQPVKAVSESLSVARLQRTARLKQPDSGAQPRRRRTFDDAVLVGQINQAVSGCPVGPSSGPGPVASAA